MSVSVHIWLAEKNEDQPVYVEFWKYLMVIGCGIVASTFLLIAGIYLTVKIYRIVHFRGDPPLLMSIVAITLALACMITFYSLDVIRILSSDDDPIINV